MLWSIFWAFITVLLFVHSPRRPRLHANSNSRLRHAIENADVLLVRAALDEGANVYPYNGIYPTALHRVLVMECEEGKRFVLAKLLIDADPQIIDEVNSEGDSGLWLALIRGHLKCAAYCIQKGRGVSDLTNPDIFFVWYNMLVNSYQSQREQRSSVRLILDGFIHAIEQDTSYDIFLSHFVCAALDNYDQQLLRIIFANTSIARKQSLTAAIKTPARKQLLRKLGLERLQLVNRAYRDAVIRYIRDEAGNVNDLFGVDMPEEIFCKICSYLAYFDKSLLI